MKAAVGTETRMGFGVGWDDGYREVEERGMKRQQAL